jgi:hypothetical protein
MTEQEPKIYKDVGDEKYSQYYFEQYKMYMAGIEKISDRRENANKYFVAINSGIVVAINYQLQHVTDYFFMQAMISFLLLGIVVSVIFYFLINSYKQLNTAKFAMLHKMEGSLPVKMYKEEWTLLGKGTDWKVYFPFSHIERIIPIVFGVGYFIVLFYFLNLFFCF